VADKLRSGTLSAEQVAERIQFWRRQGHDMSEFETPETAAAERHLPERIPVPAPPPKPPELTEAQAFEKWPCLHRVPTDRIHQCKPCRGRRSHQICECLLKQRECTVRSSDAKGKDGRPVETCLSCEVRSAPACPHYSTGCCRLAAVVGGTPVNLAPVLLSQCSACLRENSTPEIESLTEAVKDVALRAAHQWQPGQGSRVHRSVGLAPRKWTASTAGYLRDRSGRPVELGGLHRGATVFLVCGGPSLNRMDLSVLERRGVLVAAVNQVAATHVRPHLWFSVDDPSKFHESIWKDPAVLCFTKRKYLRHAVWETRDGGRKPGPKAQDLPLVVGYEHRAEWPCDFLDGAPTWGREGYFKSVFVVALRILADLGVRRICLLGADFHMDPAQAYAFDQQKDQGAANSNNGYYARLNRDLPAVWKTLLSIGCEVVNCTPGSQLTAFPTSTLADEIGRVEITPPKSVAGLY